MNVGGSVYGSQSGKPQIWRPKSLMLGHLTGAAESADTAAVNFRIYTPDSRLRVKLGVFFLRDDRDNTDPITNLAATLYVGEEEHDYSGKYGQEVICTDVLRTAAGAVVPQSSPLPIPEGVDLEGFAVEFVTAADSLIGKFTTGVQGPSGHWILQTRFQPDGQRLAPEDWDRIVRQCHPILLAPEFRLEGE